jgi:polysaccharide biosynthesis protein PslH
MNILFLTSRLPYPPHQGDRLKIYNFIRILSRRHKITLLTIVDNAEEEILANQLSDFCDRIVTVKLPSYWRYINLLTNIFSNRPFQVSYYQSKLYRKKLNELLRAGQYDIVHTHLIRMLPYSHKVKIPKVLDLTDCISNYLDSRSKATNNVLLKLGLQLELKRMLAYEKNIEDFDAVSVCSDIDKHGLLRTAPNSKIELIKNGLDIDFFTPRDDAHSEENTIIFTGNMSYAPNEDGILYFYNEIFSLLTQKLPQVKLYIVGKSPSPKVLSLASKNIIVTGRVSDLRQYYSKAQVAISPIRFGSGTLNKVIEPMAMGIPVVSTSLACQGMNLNPIYSLDKDHLNYQGENIVFADTPMEFSNSILILLGNPELRRKIGQIGRKFIENEHDWDKIVSNLEDVYKRIALR